MTSSTDGFGWTSRPEPCPGGRADDLAGSGPQPTRWDLYERQQVPAGERERGSVVVRELRRQLRPKLAGGARLGEDTRGVGHDSVEINVHKSGGVVAMRVATAA